MESKATGSAGNGLLVPGRNCWRIDRAKRLGFLIDGATYFPALRKAIARAQRSVFIVGWDIDSPHSAPRGAIFPVGSFGPTGFTGTSLWLGPESDTYVVVLSNVIHQRGGPPIVTLAGDIATAAARALHLYGS